MGQSSEPEHRDAGRQLLSSPAEPATSTTDRPHLTREQQMTLLKAPGILLTMEQRIEAARSIGETSKVEQKEVIEVWSKQGRLLKHHQIMHADSDPSKSKQSQRAHEHTEAAAARAAESHRVDSAQSDKL